jgi:tRNA(fMet)-specific endonuclease VapC
MQAGERLTTTRVNEAEFRVGIYASRDAAVEREHIERALRPLDILELDSASADRFAQVKAHVIAIGRAVGDADLLIAAIAQTHGQTLVTRNPKDFADIPGLVVESY